MRLGYLSFIVIFFALFVSGYAQDSDLGVLEFPTSGSPEAQQHFLRGVLLLHSFEYEDAREEFQAAQHIEPGFAMAYWGEAMTYNHPVWQEEDVEAGKAALQRLAPSLAERLAKAPTEREKNYLLVVELLYQPGTKESRDLAYAASMKRMSEKYPDDLEAATFYALSLLGTCHQGRDFATYMKAAAVLEEVFAKNSKHPGAIHYLIHCYDDPIHAPLGLRPARVYAKTAPAASHAQHMPSHIFLALGMWYEVAASNEVSFRVADERWKNKSLALDSRGYHALHWLQYAYLQQGKYKEALRLLKLMQGDAEQSKSKRARSHLAYMRAGYLIESRQFDGEAFAIAVDISGLGVHPRSANLFATGFALTQSGKKEKAEAVLAEIKGLQKKTKTEGEEAHHGTTGMSRYNQVRDSDYQAAEVMEKQLEGLILLSEQKTDEAVRLLKEAAKLEAQMSFEFGPPQIVKPGHELLGEILLNLGRTQEAQEEFEKGLSRAPGRVLSLVGLARAAEKNNNSSLARETYDRLRQIQRDSDQELTGL